MIAEHWLAPFIERFRAGTMAREISAALFIAARQQVVDALVTEGDVAMLTLPVREILRRSAETHVYRVLLVHTHPSGDPRPSLQDISATRRLCRHLRQQRLRLLDHIILTDEHYFSFRANRML
jgi:DNA repair protein RadC